MIRADIRRMQRAEEQMQGQIAELRQMKEELLQVEEIIKDMSYMDKTKKILIRSREAVEEQVRNLTVMTEVLRRARQEYAVTENKLIDRYNLDTVIYPRTQFATSRITGMEAHRSLMPF